MDTRKFSIHGKGKAKESKAEPEALDRDAVYSVVSHMERTLFIVDLSKLEAEGDTLVEAMVLYRPMHEFKKSQYEQRCSQLIGMSLCMKNLTGKYPEYVLLRGTGFAIHGLGNTYIMGLSSRPNEPGPCAVSYLKSIVKYFRFFFHSPDTVMQSSQGDWETFTNNMASIFDCIMEYVTTDQHSVPAMLKPLPYLNPLRKSKQVSMSCMRLLRSCQKHPPIIGGCIMHNSKLAVSQFPPSLTELLILIGGKGVDLEQRSVLEDNIAPGKVWVLEVFLTKEESNTAKDQRKDLTAFQATYASLDTNAQLSSLHWRFQSSIHSSRSSTESLNIKGRKNWRRRSRRDDSTLTRRRKEAPNLQPVASSTPHPKASSASLKSEDAIVVSPGMSKVSFTKSTTKSSSTAAAPSTGNETDELYMDAVDDVDPTAAIGPEMLRLFSRSTSHPEGGGGGGGCVVPKEDGSSPEVIIGKIKDHAHGTGSTSSEGFATPSPTPPRTSLVGAAPHSLQVEDSAAHDITGSFQTACDLSLQTSSSEEQKTTKDPANPSSSAKRGVAASPARSPLHKAKIHNGYLGGNVDSDSDDDFVDSEDIDRILNKVAITQPKTFSSPPPPQFPKRGVSPPPPIPKRGESPSPPIPKRGESSSPPIPKRVESPSPPIPKRGMSPPPLIPKRGVSMATPTTTLEAPPTPPVRGNSMARHSPQEEEKKEGEEGERREEAVDGPSAESPPPPIPPRLHAPENDSIVTGILDQASGYPFLPVGEGTQLPKRESVGAAVSPPSQPLANGKVPWIYDTLRRDDAPGFDGKVEEEQKMERQALSTSSDGHEATPIPNGDEGVLTGSRDVDKRLRKGAVKVKRKDSVDYEEIDDDVEQIKAEMAAAPNQRLVGKGGANSNMKRKDSDDYEDIDDDVEQIKAELGISDRGTASTTRQQQLDHEDRNYETIADAVNSASEHMRSSTDPPPKLPPRNTNSSGPSTAAKDVGNAALYLEHDEAIHDTEDNESKNSSMTVTLDLSHIAKDDIMYSSREKKVGNLDLAHINMTNGDSSSAEEMGGDGTVTPVEMTYNDSMFGFMKAQFERQASSRASTMEKQGGAQLEDDDSSSRLNDSGEYSSLPDEDENVFNSGDETEESMAEPVYENRAREKAKNWLSRTMDRRKIDSAEVEKYSVYVQQYMNSFIILLADSGLQNHHHILNELWRLLAEQLISLDMSFERTLQMSSASTSRTATCTVTYSGYENMCEAQPVTAAYHFRHAVRRAHQEYKTDPTLRQISLSKEHCRMLSQRVHEREVFFQPVRVGGDALSLHGMLERQAKVKCSLRQQPIGGPKIMFI